MFSEPLGQCNSLLYKFEKDKKKLVVLGVVDMRQLLLNVSFFVQYDLPFIVSECAWRCSSWQIRKQHAPV